MIMIKTILKLYGSMTLFDAARQWQKLLKKQLTLADDIAGIENYCFIPFMA